MEHKHVAPNSVDDLTESHGALLVHLKNVHRDSEGQVWIRGDAPVKLPLLLLNPENWLSVAMVRRPDGVFHLCAWPGSNTGVVAWKNMTPRLCSTSSTWTLAEFTAQS